MAVLQCNCRRVLFFLLKEYLKLGPLETKLMCMVGRAMPIHKEPEEMPSRSHIEDGIIGKSDGHITAQMIKALSKEKVG